MEVRRIFRLMLAVLVFTATLHLLAQQDEGPYCALKSRRPRQSNKSRKESGLRERRRRS
jgi:hypothetical protein